MFFTGSKVVYKDGSNAAVVSFRSYINAMTPITLVWSCSALAQSSVSRNESNLNIEIFLLASSLFRV